MAGKHDEAEKAARDAADPDRLLPGEDPGSTHVDDARMWIDVYKELLAYKKRLLGVTEDSLDNMGDPPARREVVETDRRILAAEASRLELRLDFWHRRLGQLAALTGSSDG
jgi:hypothetical protein